jgi:hypothetical protein
MSKYLKLAKAHVCIRGCFEKDHCCTVIQNEEDTHHRFSFWTLPHKGRLWIDGVAIHPDASAELRPYDRLPFSWGHHGPAVHTTSLAVLLHILGDHRQALNLYERFTEAFTCRWPMSCFQQTIDLTSFFTQNRERLHPYLQCHYFRHGRGCRTHEVDIYFDPFKKLFSIDLAKFGARAIVALGVCKKPELRERLEETYYRWFQRHLKNKGMLEDANWKKITKMADEQIRTYYEQMQNGAFSRLQRSVNKRITEVPE